MEKQLFVLGMAIVFSLGLGACGNAEKTSEDASQKSK
ncbi:iron ABC transporter substrate-binding protein [Viridibacillus sp. YIM B01967]|uniref:Iron ABC transporter substrate-binding protein n=1 Tax=Viridibacillus soli TaxID=2798301 RepID=A0ABS1HBG8_9BACL|nr:iron ABC transporter substrate-binding protein [Viridibacillus soli]MBK3496757.1 iron ABC transporter substrate-binding protein [Viridibacillus soli]